MEPRLALSLVLQLHRPRTYVGDTTPAGYRICGECRQAYPCETVRVIEGAEQLAQRDGKEDPSAPNGATPAKAGRAARG